MANFEKKDSALLLLDMAIAARTVYCFMRQYFQTRLEPRPTALALRKPDGDAEKKPIRVYMDGCFDAMHFGHANALRQAKALGDVLVVGINPAHEIIKHKGPPIMSDDERRIAVEGVKWVDEVLTNVPYVVTPEFLSELIEKHNIDIIVHGDDPCIGADGEDVYKAVKEMGRFRTVKRTEGVSSTDIVERMLRCTRDHHLAASTDPPARASQFLPTTRRLLQFASNARAPRVGERVVYVDGAFDMFHAGHVDFLRRAKQLGDFLLVGLHDDHTVNARRGTNLPIMNLHERTLSVLACRFVDEVIIGAPSAVSRDMITTMNIAVVVHGTHSESPRDEQRYAVARETGIFVEVESPNELSVADILERVRKNRDAFVKRNAKKTAAETEYLTIHKRYVAEC